MSGTLKEFAKKQEIDEPMLLSILRSLDLDREQFVKNMEEFSEGQKKKVLIAASLLTPAHLYLWDEPLNYIDVFSPAVCNFSKAQAAEGYFSQD